MSDSGLSLYDPSESRPIRTIVIRRVSCVSCRALRGFNGKFLDECLNENRRVPLDKELRLCQGRSCPGQYEGGWPGRTQPVCSRGCPVQAPLGRGFSGGVSETLEDTCSSIELHFPLDSSRPSRVDCGGILFPEREIALELGEESATDESSRPSIAWTGHPPESIDTQ
jgi:hypothetical protein